MNLEEIQALIEIVEKSRLSKLQLKQKDFELQLEVSAKNSTSSLQTDVDVAKKIVEKAATADHDYLKSPMVGTFYSAPSPDQPAFVRVGDVVKEDTVVGIVEAMKVMNEVKAGRKGVIKEVLLDNAQPVEFGTKLFRIVGK